MNTWLGHWWTNTEHSAAPAVNGRKNLLLMTQRIIGKRWNELLELQPDRNLYWHNTTIKIHSKSTVEQYICLKFEATLGCQALKNLFSLLIYHEAMRDVP